jgi:DNA-directed RNA polymerase subunit alpha
MSVDTFLVPSSIAVNPKSKYRTLITLEPLQKGFGHTLGNALRRILLSSVPGCAVVEAKIEGVLHEYDTLEGVKEDVLDILLNLKEAAFSLKGSRDRVTLELQKTGVGPVTLGDIELPHDVELINPEHVIAHLTQDRSFNMTLTVMRGQGDRLGGPLEETTDLIDENIPQEKSADINTLYLNAIFNPVKRVNYSVERARVGERTDLDKLVIDLETNGTTNPESVIRNAAFILKQPLDAILELKHPDEVVDTVENEVDPILLNSVDTLALSARAANCLKAENIYFIGDLITKTEEELLLTPNLGKRSLKEITTALESNSLALGTEIPNWPPTGLVYPEHDSKEGKGK